MTRLTRGAKCGVFSLSGESSDDRFAPLAALSASSEENAIEPRLVDRSICRLETGIISVHVLELVAHQQRLGHQRPRRIDKSFDGSKPLQQAKEAVADLRRQIDRGELGRAILNRYMTEELYHTLLAP